MNDVTPIIYSIYSIAFDVAGWSDYHGLCRLLYQIIPEGDA